MNTTVPMKYSYKTRLGNWSEEWELEEVKLKDYKRMQETGNIALQDADKKKALSENKASQTWCPDGYLKDGCTIMLHNDFSGHNLTCNVWDKISGVQENYGALLVQKWAVVKLQLFSPRFFYLIKFN